MIVGLQLFLDSSFVLGLEPDFLRFQEGAGSLLCHALLVEPELLLVLRSFE